MAIIDDEIKAKKDAINKANMKYQLALARGEDATKQQEELEALENDLKTLKDTKKKSQSQPKERKPSKLEQAAIASQSTRQLGNGSNSEQKNANQIIQQHLDSSTYFGDGQKSKEVYDQANNERVNRYKASAQEKQNPPQPSTPVTPPQPASDNQTVQQQTTQTTQENQSGQNLTDKGYPGSRDGGEGAIYHGKDDKEKKDEGEGDEKDRTGFLKRFSLLGNVFGARNPNNVLFDRRDMMRNLADEATNESATHGMEAQGWQQIANRNPYSEASKYASATNAQQIAANVTANSAKGGDQIGLSRVNNPMDINTQDQKAMDARLKAETPRQKQLNAQGQSTAYLGEAQQLNTQGKEMAGDRAESSRLSLGNGTGTSTSEGETKEKTEETTEETPAEENQPEPTPEPQLTEAEVHQILNYMTYGNDPTSSKNHFENLSDAQKALWKSWGSPQPLTEQEASKYTGIPADGKGSGFGTDSNIGQLQTAMRELRPEYWAKQKQAESQRKLDTPEQNNSMTQEQLKGMTTQVQQYACGTKNAKPGYAIVGEEGPEIVKMNGGEVVIPNNDDIDRIVSDERIKLIKEILDMGLGMSDEDFNWLVKKQGGKFNFNGKEYDWYKNEDWANDNDDSVLKGYADYIKNYLYTYKPEAQKIDKSIDPEQEHIGPMAQDIEKVNPACIVETPEGVKTVDTGRLAMMNAGAIGDLARQLRELKEVFING
ncbi:MAG: hypothetical protein J6S67_05085 [Methanobrevibacter sp.]|nr:hypothetical protein [Methanobrevibacter sp.]